MKKVFFTVGPSQSYPIVAKHMQNALKEELQSVSHRSKKFSSIYESTVSSLRKLLKIPPEHRIYFTGSAMEAMERVIQNTVKEHSAHFVNGAFSSKFFQTSADYRKKPVKIEMPFGQGFAKESLKVPPQSEIICITQTETSTGVIFPASDIYYLQKKYPKSLIAIDVVSALPYETIDFSMIDLAFFSVQKGFGLPAGLGVLIVSPRALLKAQQMNSEDIPMGSYHNFMNFEKYYQKFQTPETPNVLNIYLLGKICEDMLKYGIEKIRRETLRKANLIYGFFDQHPQYKPFVSGQEFRSRTTISINSKGQTSVLLPRLESLGFIVGRGYGKFREDQIRIANFPAHTVANVEELLQAFAGLL